MQNSECIKYELVDITPEMAQSWLDHNCGNRKLSNVVVTKLKNSILMGAWEVTHQGIAVDENGNLIDGQHRLTAIVSANKPIKSWVATYSGATTAKAKPIDIGSKRNISTVVGIDAPVAELLTFFSRILMLDKKYSSTDMVRALYENCSPQQKELLQILSLKKLPAPCRAAFFTYSSINPKKLEEALNIFDKVSTKGSDRYLNTTVKESVILNIIDTSDYSTGRFDAYYKVLQALESEKSKLYMTDKYKQECRDTVKSMFAKAIQSLAKVA